MKKCLKKRKRKEGKNTGKVMKQRRKRGGVREALKEGISDENMR